MKKVILLSLTLLGLILLFFAMSEVYAPESKESQSLPVEQEKEEASEQPTVQFYYPLSRYNERITIHAYGTLVRPGDETSLVCGRAFSGYHNGDDLEAFPEEMNVVVPVRAMVAGTVRQVSSVDGYGGLVVIEHNLSGRVVTTYYGHLNINSVALRVGSTVTAGQTIGNLGQGCSGETDGERKHLHFAIHSGSGIDVRGYVPNQNILSLWLNPKEVLASLKAN